MRRLGGGLCGLAAWCMLAGAAAWGEEDDLQWPEMDAACDKYLNAFATPKELEKMDRRFKSRVQSKVESNPAMSDDRASREIMFDWAFDNEGKIRGKEPKTILQACYYFHIFRQRNYSLPGQLRSRLNRENVQEMIDYLNEQVAKKEGGGAAKDEK
ncbi:MAG: hypothetical protein M5U26_07340 [Planctomycetota bacterium]|nr:hypothetical protein [Planctomycetota bacterium]